MPNLCTVACLIDDINVSKLMAVQSSRRSPDHLREKLDADAGFVLIQLSL